MPATTRLSPLLIPDVFFVPRTEFALVKSAFWTEPQDQSAWIYHRWLLRRVLATLPALPSLLIALGKDFQASGEADTESGDKKGGEGAPAALAVVERELEMCRELDAMEGNCKWILLTLALLLSVREGVRRVEEGKTAAEGGEYPREVVEEVAALFERLQTLDPMRTGYYRDVHRSLSTTPTQ